MLSVEAASVTNSCVMRESSTGSLWRLRFSVRFSSVGGLLHWIGESRKDRNCKSQPETSTPPVTGVLVLEACPLAKSASANPVPCPDHSPWGKHEFQYYCFWGRTVVVFRAWDRRAQALTPCC